MPVAVLPPIQATTFLPAVVTAATRPWRSVRTVMDPTLVVLATTLAVLATATATPAPLGSPMPGAVLPPIQATTFLPAVVTAATRPWRSVRTVMDPTLVVLATTLVALTPSKMAPWRNHGTILIHAPPRSRKVLALMETIPIRRSTLGAKRRVGCAQKVVLATATATPAPLGSPMPVAVLPPTQATTFLPAVVTAATRPWRSVRTVATPWVAVSLL